jgi:hypothetical protein
VLAAPPGQWNGSNPDDSVVVFDFPSYLILYMNSRVHRLACTSHVLLGVDKESQGGGALLQKRWWRPCLLTTGKRGTHREGRRQRRAQRSQDTGRQHLQYAEAAVAWKDLDINRKQNRGGFIVVKNWARLDTARVAEATNLSLGPRP